MGYDDCISINVVVASDNVDIHSLKSSENPTPMSHHSNQYHHHHHQQHMKRMMTTLVSNNNDNRYASASAAAASASADDDDGKEVFKKDSRDLEEMLSKLNPMAPEFIPHRPRQTPANTFPSPTPTPTRRNKGGGGGNNGHHHGKRRMNNRISMIQRDDVIKRTVYVSDIHHQVTEQQLAALFVNCGQVVDCRVCGDPKSVLRFAFIEFTNTEGARNALSLGGSMLGYYTVNILPSKTAIAPVNPNFLPQSENEREMCARTIYCTNIDKKVTHADVTLFFETLCGEVYRLKMLGDHNHHSRIAFVEFVMAESATAALNCSGAVLGFLPIRVSPSKTPVRPRGTRPTMR